MIKKTITYKNFNDVECTEDYYFHLTEAEIVETEVGTPGGYAAMLMSIVNSKEEYKLIKIFKELILKAYGIKSPDGKRFEKSEEISLAFSQTNAYSVLFMELARNADAAAEFVNGIMPKLTEAAK